MSHIEFFFKEMLEEKEFIKNSIIVGIATSVGAFIAFLANLFFSKIFGPEVFGTFKTILYFGGLVSTFIDLGIMLTLIKYVAEFRIKEKRKIGYLVWSLLKIRVVTYTIVLIGLFLFRSQIASYFLHDASLSYLIIPLIFAIGTGFLNILSAIVMGYEKFILSSIVSILFNILFFFIGLSLGYFLGVYYAILAFGISVVFSNMICLKYLIRQGVFQRKYEKFDVKKIFLSYSLPLHILSLPSYLINAIVPILSLFFSTKLIGYYSFAFMFYFIPSIISGSLSRVLFPKVSMLNGMKRHDDAKKTLKRVFMGYSIFVVGGIIGTLMFSELFVSLVAPAYLPGLVLFKVLIIFGLFAGYGLILNSYLNAREKLKEGALVLLIITVLLFVISFVVLKVIE